MSKAIINNNKRNLSIIRFIIFLILIINTHLFCKSNLIEEKYNVGFRYFKVFDTTRLYTTHQDTTYRPLLINFWYPSKVKSDKVNMNFKQYIDLISIRDDFSKPSAIIDKDSYNFVNAYAQFAKNSYGIGLNITTQQILDSPVKACLNLPLEKGEFPLIIYAPSNSKTPIQNHIICEFLASNGFYVISVSSAGPNSIERKDLANSILAQVEDMEFILDYIEKKVQIPYSRIGLLSYSSGGLATSIFQMKHNNVKAVYSMDGSQEYSLYISLSQLKEFDINATEIPYFIASGNSSQSIFPYLNSIKSKNKFHYRMPHLSHFGFVSYWTYFDNCNPDEGKHNYSKNYDFFCESAYKFFDATLRENEISDKKLLSLKLLKNNYAECDGENYSETTKLLNTFLQENIDSALSIYRYNKANKFNDYHYHEEEISALGRMILDYDSDASEKLFLFNIEEYPDSWHAYYDLAFAYKIKGDINLAKITLSKAQEIKPNNNEVKDLLKELENKE